MIERDIKATLSFGPDCDYNKSGYILSLVIPKELDNFVDVIAKLHRDTEYTLIISHSND